MFKHTKWTKEDLVNEIKWLLWENAKSLFGLLGIFSVSSVTKNKEYISSLNSRFLVQFGIFNN